MIFLKSIIKGKSYDFAVRTVRLYQYLTEQKHEYVMSKQVLRSATSVGANVREALQGQSKADFTAKMSIALKEASETEYWLELLRDTDYLNYDEYTSVQSDCLEIVKILTSIVKTSRNDSP